MVSTVLNSPRGMKGAVVVSSKLVAHVLSLHVSLRMAAKSGIQLQWWPAPTRNPATSAESQYPLPVNAATSSPWYHIPLGIPPVSNPSQYISRGNTSVLVMYPPAPTRSSNRRPILLSTVQQLLGTRLVWLTPGRGPPVYHATQHLQGNEAEMCTLPVW